MDIVPTQTRRRPQFTTRTVLMVTLLLAVLLSWRASVRRGELQLAQQAHRLAYAEQELSRARDELQDRVRVKPDRSRGLWMAALDGANLSGMTIASHTNAFQRATFKDCNLENATLQGGTSAFQLARFDGAKLEKAKLTGGDCAFQNATFVGADLTGAVLTGGGASFQAASFENATLISARLTGSFQLANISGAHFEGADLSALDSNSLASCYFKDPPTYDGRTKFPAGFAPAAQLWRRVGE